MAEPQRSCLACRTTLPKSQLQRWVRQQGQAVPDPAAKLPGRGFYSCSPACATKLATIIGQKRR